MKNRLTLRLAREPGGGLPPGGPSAAQGAEGKARRPDLNGNVGRSAN